MAVVGCLGDIIFTVSDRTVKTISNWKWSGSSRYAAHQRHGIDTLTEYTGTDPDKMTFDIVLMAEFGARPLREIKKLRQYTREGTPQPLTVGGYGYGKYRWSIVSYDVEIRRTTRGGEILEAAVSLTLQEYLKHELQSKRKLRRLIKAPV